MALCLHFSHLESVFIMLLVTRIRRIRRPWNMTQVVFAGLLGGLLLLPPAASIVEAAGPASSEEQGPSTNNAAPRDYTVTFRGVNRIRSEIVETAANLNPELPLTRQQLERAARRIESIPGVSDVRVVHLPAENGRETVDIQLKERSRVPHGFAGWAAIGGRAILSDEARVDIANLTSGGEVWTIGYRWSKPRERVIGRLELPMRHVPGVVAIEGLLERQSYRPPILGVALEGTELEGSDLVQRRRRLGVQVADWATGSLRWMGGTAFDSIGGREYLGLDGGVDLRMARDHLSLIVLTGFWNPFTDGDRFASGMTVLAWRSTTEEAPISFYGEAGVSAVSGHTPLAVWPGNHTSAERGGNLRAHPLRESDVIAGDVFGRRVVFGSINAEQFMRQTPFGRLSVVEFVDTGRAWQRLPGLPASSPFHVDIGLGLRLAGAKTGGTVRLDYARGLRDGRNHVSAGFVKAWPGR
jgi:hypothetical protein